MKVLLTGGNGFVGSHIIEVLREMQAHVTLLLRPNADLSFIRNHLTDTTVHLGGLIDIKIMENAIDGADAVIHCAGKTKALHKTEYDIVNHDGTRNVITAANTHRDSIKHFIYISSLAVSGPGDRQRPAREDNPPQPVTAYGRSKLRGEKAVMELAQVPWTILRPAAVYGPRDSDFFNAFKSVKQRIMPLISGGERYLSLVYVRDLALAVRCCLENKGSIGKIFHVATEPPCTDKALFQEIAVQMGVHPLSVSLPSAMLYPICLLNDLLSRITGRPQILNFQKIPELLAPGWVCATERIRNELGFTAETALPEGIQHALSWYRRQGWL
jgi:nucleoside-diphosphate-sugar epimerase